MKGPVGNTGLLHALIDVWVCMLDDFAPRLTGIL